MGPCTGSFCLGQLNGGFGFGVPDDKVQPFALSDPEGARAAVSTGRIRILQQLQALAPLHIPCKVVAGRLRGTWPLRSRRLTPNQMDQAWGCAVTSGSVDMTMSASLSPYTSQVMSAACTTPVEVACTRCRPSCGRNPGWSAEKSTSAWWHARCVGHRERECKEMKRPER